jgi:hypothetical protein
MFPGLHQHFGNNGDDNDWGFDAGDMLGDWGFGDQDWGDDDWSMSGW